MIRVQILDEAVGVSLYANAREINESICSSLKLWVNSGANWVLEPWLIPVKEKEN